MQGEAIDLAFTAGGIFALGSLFCLHKAQRYPGRLVGAGASLPPVMGAGGASLGP